MKKLTKLILKPTSWPLLLLLLTFYYSIVKTTASKFNYSTHQFPPKNQFQQFFSESTIPLNLSSIFHFPTPIVPSYLTLLYSTPQDVCISPSKAHLGLRMSRFLSLCSQKLFLNYFVIYIILIQFLKICYGFQVLVDTCFL